MGRAALVLIVVGRAATAGAAPLALLPSDKLASLAPLLTHSEMALIETERDGRPRQLTLLAYSAAPPERVREVVAHPERYPSFVRNLSKCEVTHNPDGTLDDVWQLDLPIGHFNGGSRLSFEAPPATGAPGAIEVESAAHDNHTRWEFLPAAGGGTVLVEYLQYHAPRTNRLLTRLLERDPSNETGMGLAAGLLLAKSVATEAGRQSAQAGARIPPPPVAAPGFPFLLERGAVAVIRSLPTGQLLDVSVVRRIPQPVAEVLAVVRSPEVWHDFMPAVTASRLVERAASGVIFDLDVDGILFTVETRYEMHFVPSGADTRGVSGDLEGSRFRWDLSPTSDGGTLAVYRANHNLRGASIVLRALMSYEPLFEHGANVGVGVIAVSTVARRAAALHDRH